MPVSKQWLIWSSFWKHFHNVATSMGGKGRFSPCHYHSKLCSSLCTGLAGLTLTLREILPIVKVLYYLMHEALNPHQCKKICHESPTTVKVVKFMKTKTQTWVSRSLVNTGVAKFFPMCKFTDEKTNSTPKQRCSLDKTLKIF